VPPLHPATILQPSSGRQATRPICFAEDREPDPFACDAKIRGVCTYTMLIETCFSHLAASHATRFNRHCQFTPSSNTETLHPVIWSPAMPASCFLAALWHA
jgi:hypothetical protein